VDSAVKPTQFPLARARWQWLIPLGLALFAVLLFANTFNGELMHSWDDNRYIKENPFIKNFSPQGFVNIFTHAYFAAYIPITLVTYWLEYHLWGMQPMGYHVVNVLLHAANGALVYLFLNRLLHKRRVAVFAAVLFIAHPLQVESVAWVAERKTLLAMFFMLLAFLAHLRSADEDAPAWALPAAWIMFALAAFAKPIVVGAPILFMVYDIFWAKKPLLRSIARNIMPLVIAVVASYLIVRTHESGGGIKDYRGDSIFKTLELMLVVYWDYVVSFIAPFNLNNFYIYPISFIDQYPVSVLLGGAMVVLSAVIAFVGVGASLLKRTWTFGMPFSLFAILWFWLFLAPVSNIVPIAIERADRYMYFPCILVFAALGLLIEWLWNHIPALKLRYAMAAIIAVIIAGMSFVTVQRNLVWHTEGDLWRDHLQDYPKSGTGWLNLGVYYFNTEDYADALLTFQQLLELEPNHFKGNRFMGHIAVRQARWADAIPYYQKALQINPNDAITHNYLGLAYFRLGRFNDAAQEYTRAVQLDRNMQQAYPNLGEAALQVGNYDLARQALLVAALNNPDNAVIHRSLGLAYFRLQQYEDAISQYQTALQLDENASDVYPNLGEAALRVGNNDLARQALLVAAQNNPNNAVIHSNLGLAYFRLQQYEDAINEYQTAIQLDESRTDTYPNLGTAALRTGNYDLARQALLVAVRQNPDNAAAQSDLCAALAQLDMNADAVEYCQRAAELEPDNGLYQGRYAHILLINDRPEEALPIAQRAVQVSPDLSLSFRVLGEANAALGNRQEAIDAFRRALEIDPSNSRARDGLNALIGSS
jgi:protein O-mannosyl-transferase